MTTPLRILHLEDDAYDIDLTKEMLEAEGYACRIVSVQSREEFQAALEQGKFDLIFADYTLPSFDGMTALGIAQAKRPDVPFLFVTGTIGEELAIETLKNGATDYVLKQRLTRLVPSVKRALREVEEREERKKLEEQLFQSQKMEAIGTLAGGISHDFNNILTAILTNSEFLIDNFPKDDPRVDDLVEIKKAGHRAASLIQQLLAFSRKQTLYPKVVDINEIIKNMEQLLKRTIREDVTLAARLHPSLGRTKVDPGKFEQVILNLTVNARDAMPDGGKITIETSNIKFEDPSISSRLSLEPGPYIMVSIKDNGCGMDPRTQSRIFEPFYTTKEKGKGTGLGLATVHGIIKQSGGTITVESTRGRGTTFTIFLPRVDEPLSTSQNTESPDEQLDGNETILLVEDEESVLKVARTILQSSGYHVIEAHQGEEALKLFNKLKGKIQMVISDVVMPEIDGYKLVKKIIPKKPDVKVLFISGYPNEILKEHGVYEDRSDLLHKPFLSKSLLRKVREVLDKNKTA